MNKANREADDAVVLLFMIVLIYPSPIYALVALTIVILAKIWGD